jgi:hypothetical protein
MHPARGSRYGGLTERSHVSELRVQQSDLDVVERHLRASAAPVIAAFCPSYGAVGSAGVAGALNDVESLFGHALRGVSGTAIIAADDVVAIGSAFQNADDLLAEGAR